MQRVLDIDLDFFVFDVVFWPDQSTRPDPEEHQVWPDTDALSFLRNRCGLQGRRPGFVTENHADLFPLWRAAIDRGMLVPPFHLTHVDAHADLGLGDAGYMYLLTELIREPPEDRQYPALGPLGLNDGNHLAFAIACRWISDLIYVYGEGGGGDELTLVMEGFDRAASHVQLATLTRQQIERYLRRQGKPIPAHLEPAVPYRSIRWEKFLAQGPFDFVCLTRSPPYAPVTADPLFDRIREAFIDEIHISI
jgi:hypothetical protein